jgi:hypothetical protein
MIVLERKMNSKVRATNRNAQAAKSRERERQSPIPLQTTIHRLSLVRGLSLFMGRVRLPTDTHWKQSKLQKRDPDFFAWNLRFGTFLIQLQDAIFKSEIRFQSQSKSRCMIHGTWSHICIVPCTIVLLSVVMVMAGDLDLELAKTWRLLRGVLQSSFLFMSIALGEGLLCIGGWVNGVGLGRVGWLWSVLGPDWRLRLRLGVTSYGKR